MKIFFSFSSKDFNEAKPLVEALRAKANVFFSPDSIRLGGFWTPVLAQQINEADAFVLLVTGKEPGPWQLIEYYTAFDRKVKNNAFPVIPVVAGENLQAFPFIGQLNWLTADGPLSGATAARIIAAIKGKRSNKPTPWKYINPFRGLEALDEFSADLFFGRNEEIAKAVELIANEPTKAVALVGSSGVGKSSLAKAGIVAALRRQKLQAGAKTWPGALKRSREWLFLTMKPGADPLKSLASAFLDEWELSATYAKDVENRKNWIDNLRDKKFSLTELLDSTMNRWTELKRPLPAAIFLYIDQGEELYRADKKSAERFSQCIGAALADPRFRAMLSIRSDHYGYLQADAELFPRCNMVDIAPMSRDSLVSVMAGSANALDARFAAKELPERIAEAAAEQPGAMAILAVYLADMWQAMQKRGDGILSLTAAEQSIEIASALRKRAQDYFDGHKDRQKDIQRLFVPGLVRVPKDGPPLRKYVAIADLDPKFIPIIDDLASAELRLLVTGSQDGVNKVEVAHEALFDAWTLLRGWIEGERPFLEWKEAFDQDRESWSELPKHKNLLMGGKLERAREKLNERHVDLSQADQDFIRRSRAWARQKSLSLFASVAGVIFVLASLLLFISNRNANLDVANSNLILTKEDLDRKNENLRLTVSALDKAIKESNQRYQDSLTRESRFLAEKAKQEIEANNHTLAIAIALEALPWENTKGARPLVQEATLALSDAVRGFLQIGEPIKHENTVNSAAFSPDGKRIVTASRDRTARLWDSANGAVIGRKMEHKSNVTSATFSPDGKRIVTASSDNSARLWDAATLAASDSTERYFSYAEAVAAIGAPMLHKGAVTSATFSPDGTRIVTASADKTAVLWYADTGAAIGRTMQHERIVTYAAFSPDGRRIVTASENTARLWDAGTGAAIGEPMEHEGRVSSAAFSPDGKRIVTASNNYTARLWDAGTGAAIGTPMEHKGRVGSAAFSPDGKRIVTASFDYTARLWDTKTGAAIGEKMQHEGAVISAAFSPDGKRIVTASFDDTARLWDAWTGAAIGAKMQHESAVTSAAFSPDGTRIATASRDNTVRLWDTEAVAANGTAMKHDGSVNSAAFSPDGKRVVTASDDNTARLWDAETRAAVGAPMQHERSVTSASFSLDGQRIVTASSDTARVWDAATGAAIGVPMHQDDPIFSAAISPDGKRIVTATLIRDSARIWDAETGATIGEEMQHESIVTSAAFSPDGKRIVTASRDKTARVWDAGTGVAIGVPMQHEGSVYSAAFSPDGKRIVTASNDTTARLWDAGTGAAIGTPMQHDKSVASAAFSLDGRRIVTASKDYAARLWDAGTGAAIGTPMQHEGRITSAAFSPDGKRVVTASDDTARVWDAGTGAAIGTSMHHEDDVTSAAFSPDSKRVVTASSDNTARVWDANYETFWDFITDVRKKKLKCLNADQRKSLFLSPREDIETNPDYCRLKDGEK